MAEEARQAERLEPVLRPRVRERRILVEQLSQARRLARGCRLEDVELGTLRKELVDPRLISAVDRLQELGHQAVLRSRSACSRRRIRGLASLTISSRYTM